VREGVDVGMSDDVLAVDEGPVLGRGGAVERRKQGEEAEVR
jgi:hypothetical protein